MEYRELIRGRQQAARPLACALLEKKGIAWQEEDGPQSLAAWKEEQYELLAAGVRRSLDMEALYRILNEGV